MHTELHIVQLQQVICLVLLSCTSGPPPCPALLHVFSLHLAFRVAFALSVQWCSFFLLVGWLSPGCANRVHRQTVSYKLSQCKRCSRSQASNTRSGSTNCYIRIAWAPPARQWKQYDAANLGQLWLSRRSRRHVLSTTENSHWLT